METTNYRPYVWFGMIGALLAVLNNIIATIAIGVFQGPIVAFTTPFAFAIGKLMYPKKFSATIIYLPVVIVSIFTLNFGPPGFYKFVFLLGPIAYDLISVILRFDKKSKRSTYKIWKLYIAIIFYPVGLLLGALIAIKWIISDIEIPIISKGLIGAGLMVVLFALVGSFATYISYKIYHKYIINEIEDGTV